MAVEEGAAAVGGVAGGDDVGGGQRRGQRTRRRRPASWRRRPGPGQCRPPDGPTSSPCRPPPVITSSAMNSTSCRWRTSKMRSQLLGRVHPHAAGALHQRLDDDGRDFVAYVRRVIVQPLGVERQDLGPEQAAARTGRRTTDRGRPPSRRRCRRGSRARSRRTACAPRLAAVAPVLVRHLEGDLDGGAAVVGVEDAAAAPGHRASSSSASSIAGGCVTPAKRTWSNVRGGLAQWRPSRADGGGRAGSSTTTRCRR